MRSRSPATALALLSDVLACPRFATATCSRVRHALWASPRAIRDRPARWPSRAFCGCLANSPLRHSPFGSVNRALIDDADACAVFTRAIPRRRRTLFAVAIATTSTVALPCRSSFRLWVGTDGRRSRWMAKPPPTARVSTSCRVPAPRIGVSIGHFARARHPYYHGPSSRSIWRPFRQRINLNRSRDTKLFTTALARRFEFRRCRDVCACSPRADECDAMAVQESLGEIAEIRSSRRRQRFALALAA